MFSMKELVPNLGVGQSAGIERLILGISRLFLDITGYGKSLPDPIWCAEKSEYYTPNIWSVPLPFGA